MHPEVAGDLTAVLASIKNRIKVSGLFWKFRHIVHGNIWSNYYESYTAKRRHFHSCFVGEESCNTIFEFGCASGPNLKNIEVYSNRATYCCGYDINKAAVEFAKKNLIQKNHFSRHKSPKVIYVHSYIAGVLMSLTSQFMIVCSTY